jgi:hypothetical protein
MRWQAAVQWTLFAWKAEPNSNDAIAEPFNATTGRGLSRTSGPRPALRGQDYADLRTRSELEIRGASA